MEVTHQPCPFVSCESSDAFCYNTEKKTGHCKSCDRGYPSRDKVFDWAKEKYPTSSLRGSDREDEVIMSFTPKAVVQESPDKGNWVDYRGIRPVTMEKYGVLTYSDRQEYVYPSGGIKVRLLNEKAFYAKSGFKGDELFGMNLFPAGSAKKVTVTEGELDALSIYQMMDHRYINPVVSLPSATPSKKMWEKCSEWLNGFEQIILSVDKDEAGDAIAAKFCDIFPNKVYRVDHGDFKDANDFLQAGKQKEFMSAWWGARKQTPVGFTASAEDWVSVLSEETPYEYTPTPIQDLNDKIRGWVKGGLTIIKAPPGVGKTSLFRMAQHDLVVNKGKTVAVLHMEEQKSTTARGLVTYELGINVNTREDAELWGVTEEEVKEALIRVVGEGRFLSFEVDAHDALESTLKQCNQAISVYEADYIFIDHFQRLAYLSGVDGATANLTELGVKLVELSKRKNVGIIGISHVNQDGHTKYAKSVEEEAIILIELERDKLSEDAEVRNTTYLTVTKNRPFALTGPAGAILYDSSTTLVKDKYA